MLKLWNIKMGREEGSIPVENKKNMISQITTVSTTRAEGDEEGGEAEMDATTAYWDSYDEEPFTKGRRFNKVCTCVRVRLFVRIGPECTCLPDLLYLPLCIVMVLVCTS